MRKNRTNTERKYLILLITVVVGSLVTVWIFKPSLFAFRSATNSQIATTETNGSENSTGFLPNIVKNVQQEIAPTPSPMPFAELTIPHLRNREYSSRISEQTKVSENANYTSYRASYDSDGLKLYGQLTVPKESASRTKPTEGWPAIIFLHGYIPPTNYRTFQNYSAYVDYLARNGFVVFKLDLRGHDQSEGEASGAYYSGDYIVDTLNAYSALQSTEVVNPKTIGLWGHSMAGNVSFRSFVAKQDVPAVVIWAGAVYTYEDMQEFGIDDNSYRPPAQTSERQRRREELRQTHGDFNKDSEFWKQVVPTNYLNGVTGAVEIHHAVDDAVVNVGYSRNLMSILDNTQIEHELFEYQSGGHNISGASFNTAMQRTVEFFREKLQ